MRSPLEFRWDGRTAAIAVTSCACAFLYRAIFFLDANGHVPSDLEPVEEWFFSPVGTSSALVLLLTAWFTVRRLHRLSSSSSRSVASRTFAALGYLSAIVLVFWSTYADAPQILPLSLAVLLVSTGCAVAGVHGGFVLLMPAIFVALLGTPVPTPLLNAIMYPLQLWTATAAAAIVEAFGYTIQQSGDLIHLRPTTFQVIETCAGYGSMMTLIMAAFVYGELVGLRRSRRLILILLAPAIGLAMNVLRVVALVVNPDPTSQPDHSIQGLVMTVLGVLALWGLDELMDRFSPRRETLPNVPDDASNPIPTRQIWILAIPLVLAGIVTLMIDPWQPTPRADRGVHALPREIGEWKTGQDLLPIDSEYLGSVRFSSRTSRRYWRGEESIDLFVGMNDRIRREDGFVSDKTRTLYAGSVVVMNSARSPEDEAGTHEMIVHTKTGKTLLAWHWYENTQGLLSETLRSAFALDRGPKRRNSPALVVRIATPVALEPGEEIRARRRLASFAESLRPELDKLGVASERED